MKNITIFSIAKDVGQAGSSEVLFNKDESEFVLDPEQLNEDSWAFDEKLSKIAVSDGASESYNSKLWANLLCHQFINKEPLLEFDVWLNNVIYDYVSHHNLSNMSWTQVSAYERGSFATFIGVNINEFSNKLTTICIGDSVCLLFKEVKEEKLIKKKRNKKLVRKIFQTINFEYIPMYEIPDFSINPTLLSTNRALNNFIFQDNIREIILDEKHRYYLVLGTDAISDWLINQAKILVPGSPILSKILQYTKKQLANYIYQTVIEKRNDKSMKVDDSTLIIFQIN